MKAYVITHSSSYEARAEAVGKWLAAAGCDVTWVYSDFHHLSGETLVRREPGHVYLHMKPYRKNLSVRRLSSIRAFAGDVEKFLSGRQIDLLYMIVPANSFVPVARRIKERTGAKVVLDINDLWPESLPVDHVQGLPPMRMWKDLRDRDIDCADLIFTECALFRDMLDLPAEKTKVLYWTGIERPETAGEGAAAPCEDGVLDIAYIGSINYIIDMDAIAGLTEELCRRTRVRVHVVGEGETKDKFIERLKDAGAEVADHGVTYDAAEKAAILSKCRFGLNMMVPQVKVGLTMKSLDYLAHGVPLLNNIPGDTWELVEEYDAGVNIDRDDPGSSVDTVLAMAKDPRAHEDVLRLYDEKFAPGRFSETLARELCPLISGEYPERGGTACEGTGEAGDGAVKRPLISVAMTACNGEDYIEEQLASILPQLGENDEVIVSVDPSDDMTFPILCEAAAKDPRIRVTEGPGRGPVKNVENALIRCGGKFIFLADQDDVWLPGKVEKVMTALSGSTLVLHDAKIVDEALNETEPSYMHWRGSRKGVGANIWKNSYIGCCMAFRRELLDHALPFPDDLPMHDQWLGLMAEKHGSVRFLRTPLLLYRRHGNTVTKDKRSGPARMLRWRAAITKEVIRR